MGFLIMFSFSWWWHDSTVVPILCYIGIPIVVVGHYHSYTFVGTSGTSTSNNGSNGLCRGHGMETLYGMIVFHGRDGHGIHGCYSGGGGGGRWYCECE